MEYFEENASNGLLRRYENDNKALIRSRTEVVAARKKLHERLNNLHFVSFMVTLLIVFHVLFCSRTPANEKMNPVEFSGRLFTIIVNTSLIMLFLNLLRDKAKSLKEEAEALEERFTELIDLFRSMYITNAEIHQEYNRLRRIPWEQGVAGKQTRINEFDMSRRYLNWLCGFTIISALLMFGLCVREFIC
ncbi:hypothetical protein MKW92_023472 [Papaver armeniacum]|nr:hypothetical protein MKW92_023472 [Papaver armeniacum]